MAVNQTVICDLESNKPIYVHGSKLKWRSVIGMDDGGGLYELDLLYNNNNHLLCVYTYIDIFCFCFFFIIFADQNN